MNRGMYGQDDRQREATEDDVGSVSASFRSPFKKDVGRLIHSWAFRRLQGKLQLLPAPDSDYFRNRLTHSMEVSQIARCIGRRLNTELRGNNISDQVDEDLLEFAGLAHDIGHPPFGHSGEKALNKLMKEFGGFEGNAQTLRVLTRIEKKREPIDNIGVGLNLTARTLASILKYDKILEPKSKTPKGYYSSEKELVENVKLAVGLSNGEFRTIECAIMDFADDIAYSTYDIEDCFHCGLLTVEQFYPGKCKYLKKIVSAINKRLVKFGFSKLSKNGENYPELNDSFTRSFISDSASLEESYIPNDVKLIFSSHATGSETNWGNALFELVTTTSDSWHLLEKDAVQRTDLTSTWVGKAVEGVTIEYNKEFPAFSKVKIARNTLIDIEYRKELTYHHVTNSPALRIFQYRGKQIVGALFNALKTHPELMRDRYYKKFLSAVKSTSKGKYTHTGESMRVLCDYIACLTDKAAVELYKKLTSEEHQSIFSPIS